LIFDTAGYIDGMNMYAYCGNNPTVYIDPWGLCGSKSNSRWSQFKDDLASIWEAIGDGAYLADKGMAEMVSWATGGFSDSLLGYTESHYEYADYLQKKHGWSGTFSKRAGQVSLGAAGGAVALEALGVDVILWGGGTVASNPEMTQNASNLLNPLSNTTYTPKVIQQMQNTSDIYHSFPRLIDRMATVQDVTTITGGDGITRTAVEMQGFINNTYGTFQYIIEADNSVNHRLFMPGQ
jgi:hypothetical protein